MNDMRLTPDPLDVSAAAQAVSAPDAGGIDIFIGTTRAEQHPERGALLALEYEAYEPMVTAEIARLITRARDQWPISRIVLWHRVGRVTVGEPSVLIAVSCPHRAEAFAACRFLIDELKKTVPIWKKEIYEHATHWQMERASPGPGQ